MPSMKRETERKWAAADRASIAKDVAIGVALGASSLAASFLAGLKLLKKMYYVEWLTVAALGFYLLVAWLLYLRDDAFMKRRGDKNTPTDSSTRRARRTLLTASIFLALASFLLYYGFGVGATL